MEFGKQLHGGKNEGRFGIRESMVRAASGKERDRRESPTFLREVDRLQVEAPWCCPIEALSATQEQDGWEGSCVVSLRELLLLFSP